MSRDLAPNGHDEPVVFSSKPVLPRTVVEAVRLAQGARRLVHWSERLAERSMPTGPVAWSKHLTQRFDIRSAPGAAATNFAQRLLPDALDIDDFELTVSPYAPPMRQLGSVRQGVPMWSANPHAGTSVASAAPAAVARPVSATPKPVPQREARADPNKAPADLLAIMNGHRARGR